MQQVSRPLLQADRFSNRICEQGNEGYSAVNKAELHAK